jgi:hypothetical protein
MSKRKYESVTWTTKYKNSVNVVYTDILANKTNRTHRGVVSRYETDDENSEKETRIFQEILKTFSLEEIDAATEKEEQESKARFEEEERRKREREEYEKIKKVFETKIEIFNLEEVAASENREAKAAIRRSKSSVEAIVNTVFLLMQERNNNESSE